MKEVERARDNLLASIGAALVQLNIGEANERDLDSKLDAFEDARRAQHDADRNAIRRKVGEEDCPTPKRDKDATVSVNCDAVHSVCAECKESDACVIPRQVAAIPDDGGEKYTACGELTCDDCHDEDCNGRE